MRIAACADDDTTLQQRGRHRHISLRLANAFFNAPYAVTDVKPEVPRLAQKALYSGNGGNVRAVVQQQNVHIGMRKQLEARVATDRQQRQ